MNVGEKQELRIGIFFGDLGFELFEDIQRGEVSLRLIQVFAVVSSPAKGFPWRVLDPPGINAGLLQHILVLCGEVIADYRDDPHISEEAGRQRKVSSGPAQYVDYVPGRRADVIECHRTDDE